MLKTNLRFYLAHNDFWLCGKKIISVNVGVEIANLFCAVFLKTFKSWKQQKNDFFPYYSAAKTIANFQHGTYQKMFC